MPEIDHLIGDHDWVYLECMERKRTPEQIVEVGIQLHLAGLSRSNTKQHLEKLGVQRSRTAIHNWVQKADLQPTGTRLSNYLAVDETVIQLGTERYWLYATVDTKTNEFLHVRPFTRQIRDWRTCACVNSRRKTTSTTPITSKRHCRYSDPYSMSVTTEIGIASNVSFVKSNNEHPHF